MATLCSGYSIICFVVYTCAILVALMGLEEDVIRSYKGSQVFRINFPTTPVWKDFLQDLDVNSGIDGFDIWKYPQDGGWGDIRVSADHVTLVVDLLLRHNLKYHVTVNDIESDLSKEKYSNRTRLKRDTHPKNIVGRYARYDEITDWMEYVSNMYPTIAKVIDLGKSYEGRSTKALKLGEDRPNKWKVWVDGGIHAREWISPATVIYIANRLIKGYVRHDHHTAEFLRALDWYIVPVVNPDGYEYSHTKDRFWRKNRQLFNDSRCHGIDLNRNWDFQWGGAATSSNPCDGLFKGNSPEEAQEVRNIVNFLSPRAGSFIAFLTYHAYGQNFITRWDYSKEAIPKDHKQLISLAKRAVRSMARVHGVQYQAGRAPEILYPYGGGSPDWAKAVADVKFSYLIELRDENSFLLPENEIISTGQENWAGVRVVAKEILDLYGHEFAPNVPDPIVKDHNVMVTSESKDHIAGESVFHTSSAGLVIGCYQMFYTLLLCYTFICIFAFVF